MTAICPRCDSDDTIKKGFSRSKQGKRQIFLCKSCKRRFTGDRRGQHDERFRVKAINMHTLGFTMDEIRKELGKRYKRAISKTTIHRWIQAHSHLSPMKKSRKRMKDPIVTKEMVHRGLIFRYSYHLVKMGAVRKEFPKLADYLTTIEDRPEYQEGERCSMIPLKTDVEPVPKSNFACKMAAFAVKEAKNNRERHEAVEQFFLINDTATIAKEVPIYFWEKGKGSVTGHIDILQIRFGKIHILDYKPKAKRENASGQLLLYARGLSFRTGIPLENFECGWFDENDYIPFSPAGVRWKLV